MTWYRIHVKVGHGTSWIDTTRMFSKEVPQADEEAVEKFNALKNQAEIETKQRRTVTDPIRLERIDVLEVVTSISTSKEDWVECDAG